MFELAQTLTNFVMSLVSSVLVLCNECYLVIIGAKTLSVFGQGFTSGLKILLDTLNAPSWIYGIVSFDIGWLICGGFIGTALLGFLVYKIIMRVAKLCNPAV